MWDSKHVHDLLQRPQRLLLNEPWRSMVRQSGGLNAIYNQLSNAPLSHDQRRLLDRVLTEPGRTVAYYADVLGIHVTTYHRYWRKIIATCSSILNQHEPEPVAVERWLILPHLLTSFVGRENLLDSLQTLLEQNTRLITLIGVGGAGKTRLAIEIARRCADTFQHGVVFVSLAHLDQAESVLTLIAQTLGIKEHSGQSIDDHIYTILHDQHLLLVLDNLEQIHDVGLLVDELLKQAPRLSIIATSRSMLRVYGEQVIQVPPLSIPESTNSSTIYAAEAVRLFVERAHAIDANLEFDADHLQAIAKICQHLDGIPLAVELAAARVRVLSPQVLAQRLTQNFDLLSGGSRNLPTRQQSIRDLMAWSYQLLEPHEQHAFMSLSVWVEGWTLDAAAFVLDYPCDSLELIDILANLLDSSLIVRDSNQAARWYMLRLVREYAQSQLDLHPNALNMRLKASDWLVQFAEQSVDGLKGNEQQHWLKRLDQEQHNIQAWLDWLIEHHYAEAAFRLGGSMWQYWWMRGMFSAGRQLLERVLPLADAVAPAFQIRAWNGAGALAWSQGDYAAAHNYFAHCLAVQTQLDDQRGIAMTRNNIGLIAVKQGDYSYATQLFEQNLAVFQAMHDDYSCGATLSNLGITARYQGHLEQAHDLFSQSLAIRQAVGNSWGIASSQTNLAMVAVQQGNYDQAYALYCESLGLLAEVGERDSIAECFEGLAGVFWGRNDPEKAAWLCGAADGLRASIATPRTPIDQAWFEQLSIAIQKNLDSGKFAQIWADGYSQPLDTLIASVVKC